MRLPLATGLGPYQTSSSKHISRMETRQRARRTLFWKVPWLRNFDLYVPSTSRIGIEFKPKMGALRLNLLWMLTSREELLRAVDDVYPPSEPQTD